MSKPDQKRLEDLTSFWMSLLTGYHKDRDCHFYITHDFKYHTGLELTVSHSGYIADYWEVKVDNMDEAYSVLERMLHKQILEEINSNIAIEDASEPPKEGEPGFIGPLLTGAQEALPPKWHPPLVLPPSTEKDKKFWEDKKEEFKRIYIEQCTP